jgi:quercetin dioxygenase-like cupin family protein
MLQFKLTGNKNVLWKFVFLFWAVFSSLGSFGQTFLGLDTLDVPVKDFQGVYSKKIADDSLQTTFVIWIKNRVVEHYHQAHTENIYVLEGKAKMTIDGEKQIIKKGDYLNIPMGTPHSVERVLSRKPLKVISIQSPQFDGTDRIFVLPPPQPDF